MAGTTPGEVTSGGVGRILRTGDSVQQRLPQNVTTYIYGPAVVGW